VKNRHPALLRAIPFCGTGSRTRAGSEENNRKKKQTFENEREKEKER